MNQASVCNSGLLAALSFLTISSLSPLSSHGAVDLFLEMDGIEGESIVKGHEGAIDVLAWNWGMSQSGTMHTGGGSGGGKVSIQDISITKFIDKSSPSLMEAVCTRDIFPEAKLIVTKVADRPFEWQVITMTKVIVTSISSGGSGGQDRLTETVSLQFQKVQVDYQLQDISGFPLGDWFIYWWDISANMGDAYASSDSTGFPPPDPTPIPPTPTEIPSKKSSVLVFDNAAAVNNPANELTGKTDYDSKEERTLAIVCTAEIQGASDWHFYVRKGLGGYKYLGRAGDGNTPMLIWSSKSKRIAKRFSNGPAFNSLYSFRIVRIYDGKKNGAGDIFNMNGLIGYCMEGGDPVDVTLPEMPFLKDKRIALSDDLLGLDEVASPNGIGIDTDSPGSRAIQIVWNFDTNPSQVSDYHVQVSVDGGKYEFLGQTFSGKVNYFWWTPNSEFQTAPKFADGPQDGKQYQFRVYLIPYEGQTTMMDSGRLSYSVKP